MLRDTMPRRKAEAMIDNMTDMLVKQNLDLLDALTKLLNACTTNDPSGVVCPDRREVARIRRVAKANGAVLAEQNR
jgi:hypothetical protein